MMKKTDPEQKHVKVIFQLERDSDGYPPEDREGIWASPMPNDIFRLDNIPFYVMGVSDGDLVSVEERGGEIFFKELIEPSDNCTVRVIIYDRERETEIRAKLHELGCSIEGVGIKGLIACSFDKTRYSAISQYLEGAHVQEVLDYQESSLR